MLYASLGGLYIIPSYLMLHSVRCSYSKKTKTCLYHILSGDGKCHLGKLLVFIVYKDVLIVVEPVVALSDVDYVACNDRRLIFICCVAAHFRECVDQLDELIRIVACNI